MLLAIDPGANTGWALFASGQLVACGLGEPPKTAALDDIVIEKPRIYPGGRQQARPEDIITLAVTAGETGGVLREQYGVQARYVFPSEWKGGAIDKDTSHARIRRRLGAAETAVLKGVLAVGKRKGHPMAKSLSHNVLDAVGIGLYGVGRQA